MLARDGVVMRALAAVLLVSLSLPAGAWALGELAPPAARAFVAQTVDTVVQGDEQDDDIPGVPIAPSPITGTLDDTHPAWDFDDVHRISLGYNQKLSVALSGDAGTDFDVWLWRPGSTTVEDANAKARVVSVSQTKGTSTESMWYPCSAPGTYFLDVFTDPSTTPNRGEYSLTWSVEQLDTPAVTVRVSSTKAAYGGSVTISGAASIDGEPLGGTRIQVQKRSPGRFWTSVNMDTAPTPDVPKTMTRGDGTFTYVASGITSKTEYRVLVWPTTSYGWATSGVVAVTPKAYLTRPRAPKTVKRNRAFTVYGYLKPRHLAGAKHVKITAYRSSGGTWRYARSYNYKWFTKYKRTIILPEKGRWKLVASTAADADHLATVSGATYVNVK